MTIQRYVIPERSLWEKIKDVRHYRVIKVDAYGKIYFLGHADQCQNESDRIVAELISFINISYNKRVGYYVMCYDLGELKYIGSYYHLIVEIVAGTIHQSFRTDAERLRDSLLD